MRFADARQHFVAGGVAARDRAVGNHGNAGLLAGGDHLVLIEVGVAFDLVADQRLGGRLHRLLDQRHGKIRNANLPHEAFVLQFGHGAQRLGERHARVRPMDQQQVDNIEPQLDQTFLDRTFEVMRRQPLRRHFGADHDLGAQPRRSHALTDRRLVAVHLRGVDVAIAGLDRLQDDACAVAATELPRAEAHQRNLETMGFDGVHGPPCHLLSASSRNPSRKSVRRAVSRLLHSALIGVAIVPWKKSQ